MPVSATPNLRIFLISLLILLAFSNFSDAGESLDKKRIVTTLNKALTDKYVFPEVAEKMARSVSRKLKSGAYDALSDPTALAAALERDYRAVSRDSHLRVDYSPNTADFGEPTPEQIERRRVELMQTNYGFTRLEIMPGNIGYLDLRAFRDAGRGGAVAIAAMNFLANTDAIIIDLRYNGGGSPTMIQLMTSYLFDGATHLNSFYLRETDSYQQFWTSPHVQGPKLLRQEVYVLTSAGTFSAAEEFSYNLKHLERATLVGETTGGGAHPIQYHYFEDIDFGAAIPFGRAVNPITKTNWEGTGVTPHIAVPAAEALAVAHERALEKLLAKTQNKTLRHTRQWALELLQARKTRFELSRKELAQYVGDFGNRSIRLQDDGLFYVRGARKLKMIPLGKDAFRFDELEHLRFHFERDDRGEVVGLVTRYSSGRESRSVRT